MNNFTYSSAIDTNSALKLFSESPDANATRFLAGGTNLIDLMREGIEQPQSLVDITRLPLAEVQQLPDGGLRIGAMVRNSHLAAHPLVRQKYPLLSQAILMGASAQLRNMATTGGNLMQRTRCYYFYDGAAACNKRVPGSGCDALEGFNRIHAILGASSKCIATHPSDMCVALAALDASVNISGPSGERRVPFTDFHRLPGDTPEIDTNLQRGELITSIDLPASSSGLPSTYRKVRDRASYAFALVSVAAALRVEGGMIREVRLALGGVSHKPWRASVAEQFLQGKKPTPDNFSRAAAAELAPAVPRKHNAFKVELAKRTIALALSALAGDAPSSNAGGAR
ncbi:MAG TPA: xanthine dehydrogenase family protein subunit M [Candidatus Acidoferrales bacterium]|jgi:xanthine dehydrogenase YagS FAD-binding subunit|nr:xanthine dehydrogenase family protein subunit M [Candidatus Acidoferrales bacterium]